MNVKERLSLITKQEIDMYWQIVAYRPYSYVSTKMMASSFYLQIIPDITSLCAWETWSPVQI